MTGELIFLLFSVNLLFLFLALPANESTVPYKVECQILLRKPNGKTLIHAFSNEQTMTVNSIAFVVNRTGQFIIA